MPSDAFFPFAVVHDGECPDTTGSFGICVESCDRDSNCSLTEKCCSNGCGHSCVAAVFPGRNIHYYWILHIYKYEIHFQ